MSIVLGAKPAQRGWGEDGILGTSAANTVLDLGLGPQKSEIGFSASFLPLNGHMMLMEPFSLNFPIWRMGLIISIFKEGQGLMDCPGMR